MRFMVIVKANKDSEHGVMPTTEEFAQMGDFNEELVKAGIMEAGEGLHPSSNGVRMTFGQGGGEPTITEGPFAATEELIAGYWVWNVDSKQQAIDWMKRAPFERGETIELRQIYAAEDFGESFTPELREQEERTRAMAEGKG